LFSYIFWYTLVWYRLFAVQAENRNGLYAAQVAVRLEPLVAAVIMGLWSTWVITYSPNLRTISRTITLRKDGLFSRSIINGAAEMGVGFLTETTTQKHNDGFVDFVILFERRGGGRGGPVQILFGLSEKLLDFFFYLVRN